MTAINNDEINNFFSSRYSRPIQSDIGHCKIQPIIAQPPPPPTPPPCQENKYFNLDIHETVSITLLESYNGCIKEKNIQRGKYMNNTLIDSFEEKICIEIPQGILNNEKVIIHTKGHLTTISSIGNLIVTVNIDVKLQLVDCFSYLNISQLCKKDYNIDTDDYYSKNGNDIILFKNITLREALCGYVFHLPHFNKNTYKITSLKNTIIYPGKIISIPECGFIRNGKTGNLIIKHNIIFPEQLNDKQLKIIDEVFTTLKV